MKIFAILPVKRFESSKSRLSSVLSTDARFKLSELLLEHTLSTLGKSTEISEIIVVSGDNCVKEIVTRCNAKFLEEYREEGLNKAVGLADNYSLVNGADATLVIPLDLPLLLPEDVDTMCRIAHGYKNCVVICPSVRYDGSNALLRKPVTSLKTQYDNDSFNMHINSARELGIPVRLFLSQRMMIDIDTVEDVKNLIKKSTTDGPIAYLKSVLKMYN